jgi:hypothetical protein
VDRPIVTDPTTRPPDIKSPRRSLPIAVYPAVLAVALVIELVNVAGVSPFAAVRTVVIAVAVALLVAAVGRLLLGDKDRGGILASLWVLGLLGGDDPRFALVILAATVVMLLERFALSAERKTIRWSRIGRWGSRLAGIAVLAVTIQAVQMGTLMDAWRSVTKETPLRPGPAAVADETAPDVYMILLDGHTRLDVGEELLGIDPAPLRDGLSAKGFEIAPLSRSNYVLTAEVLTSLLDQDHLSDIDRMAPLLAGTASRPAGAIVRDVINDNRTFRFLRDRGYEIHAITSGFEEVAIREADRFVDTGQINEFEIGMLRRSILGGLLTVVAPDAVSAQQRDRLLGIFGALVAAPGQATERPAFVFAHIPSPHAPWVFNADGSNRTVADLDAFYAETTASTGLSADALRAGYVGQVEDIDRRVLEALDQLDAAIAARGRPAVTVVFSDHGTWIGADGGDIRLRFKDLLAVRSTGPAVHLEPNLTLVNLLPTLFEQLYGEPWVRRPDTTYSYGPRDNFDLKPVDDPDARSSP